jgi:hypothetical protein
VEIAQPINLKHVDSLSHDGTVVVFGEDWPDSEDGPPKLWYKVLDLAQTADRDDPGVWEDATRWTRWYEVPFPPELRAAGMSLLTVKRQVDHSAARFPGCWKVLSSNGYIYLFRALDLAAEPGEDTVRVYANRYALPRELSPDGGDSKGTSGEAITVPQLRCAREARYRRSAQRETPQSNIDSQGTRDMTGMAFEEPTLEFSMLRPLEGYFTVTLTLSDVPGRDRWQFFCKATVQPEADPDADPVAPPSAVRPALACYSLLRDDDGWVDLADKFNLLNTQDDPFSIQPDRVAVLVHPLLGDLELASRPDALTFRLQEQSGGLDDEETRAVSPERVMLSALVSWVDDSESTDPSRLIAVDFPLTTTGAIEVGSEIRVDDVRFARTALSLNAPSDRVSLAPSAGQLEDMDRSSDFSVHAWVRHDNGSGTLLGQSLKDQDDPVGEDGWWAIQMDAASRELIATYCATQDRKVELKVPAPVSFTWHHLVLSKSGASLNLYVDGVLVKSSDEAESASSVAVTRPIVLGGSLGKDDTSWLDYRIDQITLYREAVTPSLDTIYLELSKEQQQHADVIGHWTFDDVEDEALLESGADLVTQTAPLFPPEPAEFEQTLGGHSTGMGLIRVPEWQMVPGAGPNLFRGADGIVRVYLAAQHENDDEPSAGTLVYDTTTTRTQFTFDWVSTTDTNERRGTVIMQGRKPGPILNRAKLTLEQGAEEGKLKLTITHPYVLNYHEEWLDLPASLTEFITVINGGASDNPDSDDVLNGNLPYYPYAAKGPYGDRQGPYASDLFQAMATAIPDNGGTPLLQPDDASSRQQGNFTGWTRAPLAVSGRFGTHQIDDGSSGTTEVKVMATADATLNGTLPLRAPGDFAVELWANPAGNSGRQTLMCWHQAQDDGVSLAIEPVNNFAFSDAPGGHVVLAETAGQAIADANNPGTAFEARFQIPHGGSGGASGDLVLVESSESWELDADAIINEALALRLADVTEDADVTAANTWATSARPAGNDPAVTIGGTVTVAMKVQGRRVLVTATQRISEPDAGSIADLWLKLVTGGSASPADEDWSVARQGENGEAYEPVEPVDTEVMLFDTKLAEPEGAYVTVAVTVDPTDDAAMVEMTKDMARATSSSTCTVDGRLLASSDSAGLWVRASNPPPSARIVLGTADAEEVPFTGAVENIQIWGAPRTEGTPLVRAVPQRSGDDALIQVSGTLRNESFVVTEVDLESGFKVATSLGDRSYETPTPVSAVDWLHLAVVCSDNIAIRCTEDGDRAVIKDADSLNPNKDLTIDCILVRDDSAQERWLFSKTNLGGDTTDITFALGITADGRPHFRYTLEVDGDYQTYNLYGDQILEVGKPYQLFASVKLAEYFNPEKQKFGKPADDAKPRSQLWMQHVLIAVWDIVGARWLGNAPRNFPTSFLEAHLRWLDDIWEGIGYQPPFLIPFPSDPGNDWTLLLRSKSEDEATQAVTFRSTSGSAVIGAYSGEDPATLEGQDLGYFRGVIGHVRMWTTTLSVADLEQLALQPGQPSGVDKPTAWWQFNENRGLQAQDSQGGAAARLNREQLWAYARETARLSLFMDGRIATLQPSSYRPSYGNAGRLRIGGRDTAGGGTEIFEGALDELRLWSDIRSNEELLDSMHRRLSGKEDDLLGYWPISARSGSLIKDEAPGAHHAELTQNSLALLKSFWTEKGAPVGDDLPQVRHLLGGQATSYTAYRVASPSTAAEYSEIQVSPEGQLVGVYKRALTWAETEGGSGFGTGFKTGDADLTYIGQAQSDPTLIGYIEGAPPVPSENLTRAYWSSGTGYAGYSGNTSVALQEAENTMLTFSSTSDRGGDLNIGVKGGLAIKGSSKISVGFSFGAHTDTEIPVPLAEFDLKPVGIQGTFDFSWSDAKSYEVGIGTARTLSNTFGLGGSWESWDQVLNPTVGRRYVPDNIGYALVKSGVANIYVMQLRSNGAMLGIQMIPDPDIPEDFNIITFKIRDDYTRQGTLDGKVGYVNDPAYPNADQARGSYFRPLEVANLDAQIEAYEAKLLANYDTFNASGLGQKPIESNDEKDVIENNIEIPYDWEKNLSKRNIVNTYVWTATGGFFAEELSTSVNRSESLGGSFSFKGMGGLVSEGSVVFGGVGFFWDLSVLGGGHIETSLTKTKSEGRDFGLSVDVACDDLLEVYTGNPQQTYSGEAAPGKVNGYRFKSFYLVPDKEHFSTFWDTVVDPDWLEDDDNDARALRQAKGNLNHVWRVFHRVTYVSRVPPKDQKSLANKGAAMRSVVHEIPNWQVVNLVLDVIRTGVDSQGNSIGISHPSSGAEVDRQFIALAVDDVVTRQWAPNAPWWQKTVTDAHEPVADDPNSTADDNRTLGALVPSTDAGKSFQNLRTDVYEYMVAYFETGLADKNPRLFEGPSGPDLVEPEEPEVPPLPPLTTLEEGAEEAIHLYLLNHSWRYHDSRGQDDLKYSWPVELRHDELPPAVQGRLVLPGSSVAANGSTQPPEKAHLAMSADWGRLGDRTTELVFRQTQVGPAVLLAPSDYLSDAQKPFHWICIDNERRDGSLAIFPVGASESVSLPGVDTQSVDKLVYLALSFTHSRPVDEDAGTPATEAELVVRWSVEGQNRIRTQRLTAVDGDSAGGHMVLGGDGEDLFHFYFAQGGFELLHLAVHAVALDEAEVERRVRALGLIT